MKCQSLACIWSRTPPLHRVTATAVLPQPLTLFTGGSDGSIISWNFSSSSTTQDEILPMAMLCGHATTIADLAICLPTTNSNYSLISVCSDGVLCVWSRNSMHCRRRRKLPPWMGTPFSLYTLPTSPRYVCVASSTLDTAHVSIDSSEPMGSVESSHKRVSTKYAVAIIDSYTLNVVHTVFHGSLSIGPLKFMSVVSCFEGDVQFSTVLLSDELGRIQSVKVPPENSEQFGKAGSGTHMLSPMSILVEGNGVADGEYVISVATRRQLLVLIYRTHCVFRLVGNGTAIGEISLLDTPLCDENVHCQSHVAGGMFVVSDDSAKVLDNEIIKNGFVENFAVWSDRGAALVYKVLSSDESFVFELLCEIPAVSHPPDVKISISFRQLNNKVLRIESICCVSVESSLWKPHITIWLLFHPKAAHQKLGHQCELLGEGGLDNWTENSSDFSKAESPKYNASVAPISGTVQTSPRKSLPASLKNANGLCEEDTKNGLLLNEQIVSSSMVLFDDFCTPRAIVYGLYNGEIEVVRIELCFPELDSCGSPHHKIKSHLSEQSFSGHKGPILCLAAHHMAGTSIVKNFSQVLISGSADCTIRIWDLDTSCLITVMHNHVAPVRQIILPPACTNRPWNDCFLSVGEDSCVVLVSLETLRVERVFSGHPNYPALVVWDSARGYIVSLCKSQMGLSDAIDVVYIWDVKTGVRERILRGPASRSMFDHFCGGININSITDNVLGGITSASSLLLPIIEDVNFSHTHSKNLEKGTNSLYAQQRTIRYSTEVTTSLAGASKGKSADHIPSLQSVQKNQHPIKCSCPFPGIATLKFDLSSLMSLCQDCTQSVENANRQDHAHLSHNEHDPTTSPSVKLNNISDAQRSISVPIEEHEWFKSLEGYIVRSSLSFLHLWGVDHEVDKLLTSEMNVNRPQNVVVTSGLQGDRGSLTLTFPGCDLELWRSSSEFCAMRSLTIVALAQRMVSLSLSSSSASSALAAFYTRNFAERYSDIKPPSLQILVSFWQDENEHVRMAARSLFHCAASRAIPHPVFAQKVDQTSLFPVFTSAGRDEDFNKSETSARSLVESESVTDTKDDTQIEEASIIQWLEAFETQDWISCVGGTIQDAMASQIIVAAALAIWYPSLVKTKLAVLVVHPLIKLVMSMNGKYSSTAAELLAEGMENTWKAVISPEISHLIGDVFFQIESVTGASANSSEQNPVVPVTIQETLVQILLPSLAMADIPGFLHVIESQIWSTASDSPVHLVSLMTLIRVVRGSPKPLAQYLDKVLKFILQTMDHGNSVMRQACLQTSLAALKEVVRVYPMVSLNETSTRLAVGDAIGDAHSVAIWVYDMQSVSKIKVLDANGPPGLPGLLGGASETAVTTAISALSFSPDGEGLVAFSEHGLMIRWWSLGSAWWEKLSRSFVPVQCTKVIFVPPWEGFSPNSSRLSIMASITGHDRSVNSEEKSKSSSDSDSLKLLIYNLELSYRLEWVEKRKVQLTWHGHELGTFQL